MQLRLKEHWKLVALGLALLVAIAFIVVSVISDSSDAAWPKQKTGGPIVEQGVVDVDLSDPPQQAWELDVRALTDNPGDVLLSMPSTLDSYYGYGNTYQVSDVLVAATAYPLPKTDESSSSQGVGAVTLVGVNPDDGSPLWKTRIGGVIGQCSQQNESTIIACWGDRRMIFVDTATGTLMSDLGTDFDLNGATIAGDTVYTSGERMDGTVRTRILASGTTTNLTANFVRTFEPSEKFGAVYTVPHTDTVIAMEQGDGGDPQVPLSNLRSAVRRRAIPIRGRFACPYRERIVPHQCRRPVGICRNPKPLGFRRIHDSCDTDSLVLIVVLPE
ncbi:hypothetical protein [Rhodococcus sp. FH8]|uniref:hypothetical protein n=1 Tax=Rhodococcus sp. FH8 TaxID=1761013 RepID=UPI00211A8317|nr:hypothetical protein [Rhodococcus sp. FH8]